MKFTCRILTTTLAFALLDATPLFAATVLQSVIPFATQDSVRVQIAVGGAGASDVPLHARIVPAGEQGAPALWEGTLGGARVSGTSATVEQTIRNLEPELWTPGAPNLYDLQVTAGTGADAATTSVRFGFRSVTSKDGQVLLNGKPIFLKGIAINPPGRDVPEELAYSRQYAYDYVKYLRSQNVNLIRMNFTFTADERQQAWFDACDELGMMVYQGNYGGPPGGGKKKGPSFDPEEQADLFGSKGPGVAPNAKSAPPEDFEGSLAIYKQVFETYARHPSIIIYVLANELPGPVGSREDWHEFLVKLDERINAWDPTRLVIGNAGYGLGGEGDINDVHRYWGWYYNSFLTYYNLRDTVKLFGDATDKQPFTFSECVGSFTSPLGSFNAIFRKQLAPQLGWTGHSGNQREDALAYQCFMVKHALESFRTMREQNHRIAGLMPFSIMFFNWEGIKSFAEMEAKPALHQMGVSYAPILTSIELWTAQVYAGGKIRPVVHVVNDAEDFSELTQASLKLSIMGADKAAVWSQVYPVPTLKYYEARAFSLGLTVPQIATGDYLLTAEVERGGKMISRNQESLYVRGPMSQMASGAALPFFDPSGRTAAALKKVGYNAQSIASLGAIPAGAKSLVIGEGALAGVDGAALKQYIANGGRLLCLAQEGETFDTSWIPAKVQMLKGTATDPTYTPQIRPTGDQQNINPERPWHPVFVGIGRERLRLWSDYTDWDQSKPGFPKVYPVTHGFKLTDATDLQKTAILADYDRGLEGVAIAEMFEGKGSVVLTGLDLVNRIGVDPIAADTLRNLVNYMGRPEHELHPMIEKPITWGDYPTERGVLTGPLHGLVYNCRWVAPPGAPNAKPLPDNTGAWNTSPGNPFEPKGIRPFGPYGWSTGASPREESKEPTGSGVFHCRVPAGKTNVVTTVQNMDASAQAFTVTINGGASASVQVAPGGKSQVVRTPITDGATTLQVQYAGSKQLVILETAFE